MIFTFQKYRRSFTLIELLVVIAIIGVMAGMVTYSLAGASTDAKIVRTKGTISKLNNIVLQEWEKFRYRAARIDVPADWLRPLANESSALRGQPPLSPRESARLRLMVLRDLMRMEMPDRLSDIVYPPTQYRVALFTANNYGSTADGSDDEGYWVPDRVVPGKMNNYRVKFRLGQIASPFAVAGEPSPIPASPALNAINISAECLYQIVAAANYQGGSALEAFRPSEVGDTDEDGFPEFLDAWGNPIRWIRWPAGFQSPLNSTAVPDALDPLRADWRHSKLAAYQPPAFTPKPWLLVPLIVSGGPDEAIDLTFDLGTLVYATQRWTFATDSASHRSDGAYHFVDPYVGVYDASTGVYNDANGDGFADMALGSPIDVDGDGLNHLDNITNYDIILE